MASEAAKGLSRIARELEKLSTEDRMVALSFVAPTTGNGTTIAVDRAGVAKKVAAILDKMTPGDQRATLAFFRDQLAE